MDGMNREILSTYTGMGVEIADMFKNVTYFDTGMTIPNRRVIFTR